MIEKIYECACDICGTCVNHYIGYRPDATDFKRDGIKYKYSKGKLTLFCDDCYEKQNGRLEHADIF